MASPLERCEFCARRTRTDLALGPPVFDREQGPCGPRAPLGQQGRNRSFPCAFDAVVCSASIAKEAPLDTYVFDAAASSLPTHEPYSMLGIALQAPVNGSMEASVWAFHGFNDARKQGQRRYKIFSGVGKSGGELMARLEAAGIAFARESAGTARTVEHVVLEPLAPEKHIFLARGGSFLRKVVFDPVRLEQWRGVTEAGEEIYKELGGSVVRLQDRSRTPLYVEYPFVPGVHVPRTAKEAALAAHALRTLHDKGFIHGDIRLSNLLFDGETGTAQLIDFDLAGYKTKESLYPNNFSPTLRDGVRADGAEAGSVMRQTHDWEALAGTFQACLNAPDDQERWKAALDSLKRGDATKLEEMGAATLELTKDGLAFFGADQGGRRRKGTDWPPDARKRKRGDNR